MQSEEPIMTATKPPNTLVTTTTSSEPTQSPTSVTSLNTTTASTQEPAKSSVLSSSDPEPTPKPTSKPTPTEIDVSQTTTSSEEEEPTRGSVREEQIYANRNSGGGSPFDNILPENEASHIRRGPLMGLVAALLATIILI